MSPPRLLRQPGPVAPRRIDSFRGEPVMLNLTLREGCSLAEALTSPLVEAGLQCATIRFAGVDLAPFRYVIPAPASDDRHVAYFSAPHAPAGTSRVELASATFGYSDGQPAIHCHAVWQEPNGARRGGHILPTETFIAGAAAAAVACGFRDIRITTQPDPETNFTLFKPSGASTPGIGIVARVAPNEDILTAIEAIARAHGVHNATIRGSLGSLVGTRFADGSQVTDHATEVLVRDGHIRDGVAALDLLVADMRGMVHEGWLEHGQNPVCITFDLVLEEISARSAPPEAAV
ncbi:MAG TPA: DUF296 domain-containing protein, partial [Rhodopila sp.]|nr:DUF296 domain-containing protein [Rhodopila sp.]